MTARLLFLFTGIGLLFCASVEAQLTNGLIGHWNFNGNTNDISGNSLNGTATNVTFTTGKQGVANTAANFNGNSYILVPYNSVMNLNQFTICALVQVKGYYSGACQTNYILTRGVEKASGHYALFLSDNAFDNASCTAFDTSKHVFYSHMRNKTNFVSHSLWQYTPTIVSNTWYCVVSTYDGTYNKIYVDGVLKASVQLPSGPLGTSQEGMTLGATRFGNYQSFPYWFTGNIDDLRLYNRALTQLEVDSFCNLFSSPVTSPEVTISQPLSPTSFCPGQQLNVPYTVTSAFNAGNVFTAQLSDATGSFAAPVTIGSVTATGAGVINCTIPNNTPAGNGYRVRISASNPADISPDNGVNLIINNAPTINPAPIQAVCIGDNLQLNAGVSPATSNINWSGPSGFTATGNIVTIPNAQKSSSGKYIITASSGVCTVTDTIEVVIDSNNANLGNDTTLCNDEYMVLNSGVKGATHTWQDGSIADSFLANKPGTYHATVTLGSCVARDTIVIDYIKIFIDLPEDTTICPDVSYTLSVPDTFDSYTWNVLGHESYPTVPVTNEGVYQVIVTKGKCKKSETTKVFMLKPLFELGKDTSLCIGSTLKLEANSTPGSEYHWQDGHRESTYTVHEPGFYFVTAYNECGTFTDNINVDFENCDCTPIMPTAFTPNNDGLNDNIGPMLQCNPKKYRFVIANRWGEIVFDTENRKRRWDGDHYGKKAGMDVYNYFIQIIDPTGKETMHKGNIMLLR